MSTSTADESREALATWGRREKDNKTARDPLVTQALRLGITREEIHLLTGLGRTTIDRIVGKVSAPEPAAERSS
jgi:hypothetical protein